MIFYLGTHMPTWLRRTDVRLFLSRRKLTGRRTFRATGSWALDSGGFTELEQFGGWRTTEDDYVSDVLLFSWAYLWGQVVGKGWMKLAAVLLLAAVQRRRREALA